MTFSRRSVLRSGLAVAGAGVAGGVLSACDTGTGAGRTANATSLTPTSATVRHRWFGTRQGGIVDPPPLHAHWLALNLPEKADVDHLRRTMRVLSDASARIVAGGTPLTDEAHEMAPPAGAVSITFGLGRRIFDLDGVTARPPSWLRPLPAFPIDKLDARWAQSDLVVQVCADDPLHVSRSTELLHQQSLGLAKTAWQQRGFRPAPRPADRGFIRNHFGQLDGQVQPSLTGTDDALLWNTGKEQPWMKDATGLVIRRIRMDVAEWDATDRVTRENSIGRRLHDGAPLSGGGADAAADLTAKDSSGLTAINPASHVARSMPKSPHERFLRRPYNYEDVWADGTSEKGLIFAAFCADIERQFVPVQRRLAQADILNVWTTPVGSSVYVVPRAPADGEYLAQRLLDA